MLLLRSHPHPALQGSIAQYLYVSFNTTELSTARQTVLPYDIPAFAFINGPVFIERKKCISTFPINLTYNSITSFFVGLATAPYSLIFEENKDVEALFIAFRSAGFATLFQIDMKELTDEVADFKMVAGASNAGLFIEQLAASNTFNEMVNVVNDFFIKRIPDARNYGQVGEACKKVVLTNGLIKMKELASYTNMSLSTLERQFTKRVGVPPKLFARAKRFHHALALMNSKKNFSWTELSCICGYYDQAHFIKEFKTFSNISPAAYSPAEFELYNQLILFRKYILF